MVLLRGPCFVQVLAYTAFLSLTFRVSKLAYTVCLCHVFVCRVRLSCDDEISLTRQCYYKSLIRVKILSNYKKYYYYIITP